METNKQNDCNQSSDEELLQLFYQIKQDFKQEVEEKENFKQKLEFIENNSEWSKECIQQLRQQLSNYQTIIESQQNSLNQTKQIKETNKELNEKICELNEILKKNEKSNEEEMEKIRSQLSSEIEDLNSRLSQKEKDIQDLKFTISSKDILLNQSKRELFDNKNKCEENIEEIKLFYENKIKSIYKEFDDNYQKINKQNDEKIIEIRANCMRSVDKTKDQFETKLYKIENENKELKEKNSELRLELEAIKMSNQFQNQRNNTKNLKTSANKVKSGNQSIPPPKLKLNIQGLSSDEELNQSISQSVSKRKKLIQSNDSYLDFVRNSTEFD